MYVSENAVVILKRSGICSSDQSRILLIIFMYELCLLLVCKIGLMRLFILSLVEVTPTGPLYIAINTSRTIYSSVPHGGRAVDWLILFQHSRSIIFYYVPGFTVIRTETSSDLTINTTDTSITGCIAFLAVLPGPLLQKYVKLTIYGMLIL